MKMRELSRASGVPVPTIKYYIRAGLLEAGEHTSRNQADYGEKHVERLRLIRALREVGGLSVATIGEVLTLSTGTRGGTAAAMGQAMDAISRGEWRDGGEEIEEVRALAKEVRDRLRAEGWLFRAEAGALEGLARALIRGYEAFGEAPEVEGVVRYAGPAMEIARREFAGRQSGPLEEGDASVSWAVLGTMMFEPVILALRRLAHEHLAIEQLPADVREAVAGDEA